MLIKPIISESLISQVQATPLFIKRSVKKISEIQYSVFLSWLKWLNELINFAPKMVLG